MQDLFTNKFPLDGKIKRSVAGVSGNGRKKWFPLVGIRLFFKNWISSMVSTNRKNLQIIEYCFKLTENRFSLAGMENMFKNT